jgi:ferrochelatase
LIGLTDLTADLNGDANRTRLAASASSLHIALQLPQQNETIMPESTSRFGFVAFAETWNGRLAMLGFVIGLGTELLTGQGILGQLGLG